MRSFEANSTFTDTVVIYSHDVLLSGSWFINRVDPSFSAVLKDGLLSRDPLTLSGRCMINKKTIPDRAF